jgi:phosphate transport system substrate-binding protein
LRSPTSRALRLSATLLALSLFAAACGDDDGDTADASPSSASAAEGGDVSGTVDISGSSTVEPISIAVAETFADVAPDVDVTVDGPGTGDGFKLFCAGETDINDASSKIKADQVAECEAAGVDFVELQIGNDGIAVMTNAANDAVECLTLADLYALVGPESQGVSTWADAQPLAAELGSTTELPDEPLEITGPGEESGTYASFVELVIEELNEGRGQEAETRPDYQASPDDNIIIQGIQGSSTSLGWVGYAFARDAADVKVLEVDAGDGCVAPTDETIADGSYPIARPLFLYVNVDKAAENPALAAYVDHYLSEEGIAAVSEVGYVELAEDDLEALRTTWDARTTGAQ